MLLKNIVRLAVHTQMLPILESGEETLVGGQAVMEGVMMRAPHSYCVAVRKPNGEIITEEAPLHRMSEKYPIFKLPIFRGMGSLGQAMHLGVKALKFSANAAMSEEEAGKESKEIPAWIMTANMVFSFLFFVFLYKLVPLWITTQLAKAYPSVQGQFLNGLIDGLIRITIFLVFLYGLSRYKDIHRIFEYHGAEHKVVFNFESGKPVNVENAQKFVTFHPRCGTSFLLVVMVLSMIIYMFLPFQSFAMKMASRIVLIPVIAGLSFELIRYASRNGGGLMAALTAPGLWLQRITTQPPANDQTEIAIVALNGAMELEKNQGGELIIA